jgi:putative membrane protein
MQAQVDDHDKMQQLLAAEATNGRDADLKKFAAKILPTVTEHHQMARELEARMGK